LEFFYAENLGRKKNGIGFDSKKIFESVKGRAGMK